MSTTAFPADLIRPWYPGVDGAHINADCPLLARETDTPAEGSGWLDPGRTHHLCPSCFSWDAQCQCGARLSYEGEPGLHDKECAEKWAREHFCHPSIDYTATPRPADTATPQVDGQAPLFAMEPAA